VTNENDEDKFIETTIASMREMTPSAVRPCLDEMVSEGLLTRSQADHVLREVRKEPSN
jgi:DNA-binding PadR family transcriptional regulator